LIFLYIFQETSTEDEVSVDEEMMTRLNHLKQVCQDLGLDQPGEDDLHRPKPEEFLINKEHHLVWCNIFKSGSSR